MENTIRGVSSVSGATAIVVALGMVKRIGVAVLVTSVVVASGAARANPDGVTVVSGQVTVSRPNASTLNITNSNGSILNWNSFSIRPGETTHFVQPNAASGVLNRVLGRNPSDLLGTLQSNGRVFLVNPNGIVFGPGAVIDTAGLVASTLNMSDADFLAGRMRFATVDSAGQIVNQGTLRAGANGQILLIAPNIRNEGVIETKNGKIILAAGRKVELTGPGLEDVYFEVQAPEDQIVNLGRIDATDGAAKLFAGTLRHSGTIRANGLARNAAGEIVLTAKQDIEIESGSRLEANGMNGGAIHVQSENGTTAVLGAVEARASEGKGGVVTLLGNKVSVSGNATIDVSGDTGGGTVLLGGNLRGRGPERNAAMVDFGPNAAINADAKRNGDGGKIIVWADDTANVDGTLTARGGSVSGNGGFIETSAKRSLYLSRTAVDASAPRGKGGTWLIDPRNIQIESGGSSGPNIVGADVINSALNSGMDVTLDTSDATQSAVGDITQHPSATISKTAGGDATLTLSADRNILLNDSITASNGRLTLIVQAGTTGVGAVDIEGAISTHGGDITISGSNNDSNNVFGFGIGVGIGRIGNAPVIDSGGGNISITGTTTSTTGTTSDSGGDRGISVEGRINSGGGKITMTASSVTHSGIHTFEPIDSGGGEVSFTVTSPTEIFIESSLKSGAGGMTLSGGSITIGGGSTGLDIIGDVSLLSLDSITQDPGAPITKTAGGDATLTLRANGNILLNDSITATSGRLNLNVIGDQDGNGAGAVEIAGATISTNRGNITISGTNSNSNNAFANGAGVLIGNSVDHPVVNSGGGNISITGRTTSTQDFPPNSGFDRGIDIEGPISSGGGNITLTASNIEQLGIVTFQPIDSGGGDVSFTVDSATNNRIVVQSSLRSGVGNVTLTANRVNGVLGITRLIGTGDLTVQPFSPTQSIGIGSGSGGFDVPQAALDDWSVGGFRSLTIGRADGQHLISVADATFGNSTTHLRAPIGGSITFGNVGLGGSLSVDAADITLGNLSTSAGGVITVSNSGVGIQAPGTIISGSSGLVKEGAGSLTLSSGNTYTGTTTINLGTLRLGAANSLPSSTALKVSGGTLDLQDFSSTVGSVALNGGTIISTATLTAATYDLAGGNVNANLGAGTLNQTANVTNLNGTSAANVVNVTGGALVLGSTERLSDNAAVLVNAGTLDVRGDGETVDSVDQRGGTILGKLNASGEFVNTGTLVIASNRFFGRLTNNGTVDIQSGSLSTSGDYTQAAGETRIASGTILAAGGRFVLNGGRISGNGTIKGDVTNSGATLAPGASPGTLIIIGNYTQAPGATLNVELAGFTQGVSYDLLDISGHASLAGSLNVVLTGGFFPAFGSSFDVLQYNSASGNFSAINGPPGVAFAGKPNPSAYGLGSGGPPLVQDPTLLSGDKDDSDKSCQR